MSPIRYPTHDKLEEKATGRRPTDAATKEKERESEDLLELMGFFSPGSKPATGLRQPLFRR